jgi:DUF971 family protein
LVEGNALTENRVRLLPENVAVDKTKKLMRIKWNDGRDGTYSFEQLRAACPCAECKAHKTNDNPLRRAMLVSTDLDDAQLVGNYAIQLLWDDGHRFGIYTWAYLQSLG